MATYAKNLLSESVNGKAVKVAQTASPGTLIHTGSTNTAVTDEVWLYAVNLDTTPRKLTVQWGGTASPDDEIEVTIPSESGLVLVAPGLLLKGAATALVIRAFASAGNVIALHGYANRITV